MKSSGAVSILVPVLAAVALGALVLAQWAPARAEKRSRTEAAPAVRGAKTTGKLETSARDPVRELRAQVAALQQRVAELEAQVETLGGEAPADGLAARVAALEGVLAVAPGGDVTLSSPGKVSIEGSVVDLDAASVQAEAGTATFSGVVNVQALHAKSVVADEMSSAAGNVW